MVITMKLKSNTLKRIVDDHKTINLDFSINCI